MSLLCLPRRILDAHKAFERIPSMAKVMDAEADLDIVQVSEERASLTRRLPSIGTELNPVPSSK
jgi:hypothetical protein